MFNVFKKAKLADSYAQRIKELEFELSESSNRISKLVKDCDKALDQRDELSTEVNKLFDENVLLKHKTSELNKMITDLSKKLKAYETESTDAENTNGEFLSKVELEIQNIDTAVKHVKLKDFIRVITDTDLSNPDKVESNTVEKVYYYINCIKDLSEYLYKNGLSIRKR